MIIPVYLPYYVVTGAIGIIPAILIGLDRSLGNAHWTPDDRTAVLRAAALTIIGWFLLSVALASAGSYSASADRVPMIPFGILLPIIAGGLLFCRSVRLAQIIDAIPQHWLVGVQLYRALCVIFLILHGTGMLPRLFAWPAGLGDVLVGVLAPVVAIAYSRGPRENADLVSTWNLFGLSNLVVAVAAGFFTSASPCQLFAFDRPNELISQFPLVLVPVFLVPVSVLLHCASLAKLRQDAVAGRGRRESARASA